MHNKHHHLSLLLLLLLLTLCGLAHSRFITYRPSSSSSDLISDGVQTFPTTTTSYLRANHLFSTADESCEPTYGFVPCTTSVLGNLFLILVYGSLMLVAARFLSNGSDNLLKILGPGVVGGLILPILDTLPDAMLILFSGIFGTVETAQSKVSVGMGVLAGSTVLFLTVIWGSCVVFGSCGLQDSNALDGQNTKGFHLTGTGVSTDEWTYRTARMMAISVLPFIVLQLLPLLDSTSGRHLAVLIALIISLLMLASYCIVQVIQPKFQKRRIAYLKKKHVNSETLRKFKTRALEMLLVDGEPNREVIELLFDASDENEDGKLSCSELKELIMAFLFEEERDSDVEHAAQILLQKFDTSKDGHIDMTEFVNGIRKWHKPKKREHDGEDPSDEIYEQPKEREHDGEDPSDEKPEKEKNPFNAVMMLLLGTVIAAVLANPLVDAIENFSDATSIPSFFVSFIASPFATNSSEAVSVIISASRKMTRTTSLTFSELYGAVAMNNAMCLPVLLALVYFRGLTWDFSSEVLVVLIVCIVMGVFVSFRTTFPLWTCSVAYILCPISLAMVYVLRYVFDWS